ncbi:MAG TPA: hypothetical protein VN034_01000 [Sphingopyxis sp.]|nr:hypothetical protein [Sphingopyxis sp.]
MWESAVNDVSARTVLVVEDDPLVLLSAVAMIEDAGYDVLEAANADEAIALLEAIRRSASCLPISKCPDPWMD